MFRDPPAHYVAVEGDVDTMRVFTAAGIGFHARGYTGQTILRLAILYGDKEMLEYLLGQERGRRIIHVRGNYGDTPPGIAVYTDKREMVERLVEFGAKS